MTRRLIVLGVIPARIGSTRLPRKPLAPLAGKPLVRWVYEAARRARGLDALVVATDSAEVAEIARGFGAEVAMTRGDHPSGTDRVAEVARARHDAEVIVNVQGDLPLLPPEYVEAAIAPFLAGGAGGGGGAGGASVSAGSGAAAGAPRMATLATRLTDPAEESDPGVAKVVADRRGNALYFSRAPIPYAHGAAGAGDGIERWRQIGIYTFTRETLFEFVALSPSPLEKAEGLEQLRALENGIAIRIVTVPSATPHVDTPEDLERVEAILRGR